MILNKKGLSQVVGTLLMVLLTIAAIGAVWGVIDAFVNDRLEDTAACYDVYDKVTLNNEYSCYNVTSDQTYISVEVKDIIIDSLVVAVAYNGLSDPFELTNQSQIISNVLMYPSLANSVSMPGPSSGKTYVLDVSGVPEKISIAPKISGNQCDASSSISNIPTCI